MAPFGSYKVLVHAGGSYPDVCYDGAGNFVEAYAYGTDICRFLAPDGSAVEGYLEDSATAADIPGVPVYAFRAPTGEFASLRSRARTVATRSGYLRGNTSC